VEQAIIPLATGEIHLWLAFYDQIADERLHAAYRNMLNAAEREQEPRFHFARDRRRYLVTRALVRSVLSRYEPIPPEQWCFPTNAYGRPEILDAQASGGGLSFNISHTHSLIALGVTRHRALGIDVENFRAREAPLDVADHYFAPPEVAALNAVPRDEQQYRFFEYWTFKESYIKARGMGLSLPLDKFSFHYPDDAAVELTIDRQLGDDAARWEFWQFRPAAEYLLAICAERVEAESPRLTVRQAVPLSGDRPFVPRFLRRSNHVSMRHE
jgi:4'-phosphopantetheinyl transferase